jgi:hypothetical protein
VPVVKANLKAVRVFPDDELAAVGPFQLFRHQHQLFHDVGEPESNKQLNYYWFYLRQWHSHSQ